MKVSLALAGVALAAATLSACGDDSGGGDTDGGDTNTSADGGDSTEAGGNDIDAYCVQLTGAVDTFESIDEGNLIDIQKGFDAMKSLADSAPEEISAQWLVMTSMVDQFNQVLEDSGLTADQLAAMSAGELPEGVDEAAINNFVNSMESIDTTAVDEAGQQIEDHAQSECGVDMSPGDDAAELDVPDADDNSDD